MDVCKPKKGEETMLRGIQKQMIVVKPPMGSPFERAYFVLRRSEPPKDAMREDMVRQAHRILADGERVRRMRRGGALCWLWFLLGSCFGAFLMGLLWLALS